MTRDDITRMALEAGLTEWHPSIQQHGFTFAHFDRLERFAALVATHEREACAEIARKAISKYERFEDQRAAGNTARKIEADIRARGDDAAS